MSDTRTTSPDPDSPGDEPAEHTDDSTTLPPEQPAVEDVASGESQTDADNQDLTDPDAASDSEEIADPTAPPQDEAPHSPQALEPVDAVETSAEQDSEADDADASETVVQDVSEESAVSDTSPESTVDGAGTDEVSAEDALATTEPEVIADSQEASPGADAGEEETAPDEAPDIAQEEPEAPGWDMAEPSSDDDRQYDWPEVAGRASRQRPLPWLDWRFSIVLPLAALGIVATMLWQTLIPAETVTFRIEDAETGEAIAGATVVVGQLVFRSGDDGTVVIERPEGAVEVTIEAEGYYAVVGNLDGESGSNQDVQLRPESGNQ